MLKQLLCIIIMLGILFIPKTALASSEKNFITIVNPIRGSDFWSENEDPKDTVLGEQRILKSYNLPATWLIRYDALTNQSLQSVFKGFSSTDQTGLFLEVTPSWANDAAITYHKSSNWHAAGSIFLSGYSPEERQRLIDTAFEKYKALYDKYPLSVGAWWIDSYSLSYMQQRYHITSALIVADQYSTDNYQIWGQYWEAPYYPDKNNTLKPAQSAEEKLPVVITQWAARDPINGYGKGVEESTYSVQANDYIDYHNLGTNYFSSLLDIYLDQPQNKVNQIVVGLENSYSWDKYKDEYDRQIKEIRSRQDANFANVTTMSQFASWYTNRFTGVSPNQSIFTKDPLKTTKTAVWFMNPYYRVAWQYDGRDSAFVDIRQYVPGQTELCRNEACDKVNFATFATRVLDNVTYGTLWQIDQGRVKNINLDFSDDKVNLSYINASNKKRSIFFLPRDISIDNTTTSIDTAIMNVLTASQPDREKISNDVITAKGSLMQSIPGLAISLIKFIFLVFVGLFIPGSLALKQSGKQIGFGLHSMLSIGIGIVLITLTGFISGLVGVAWITYLYIGAALLWWIKNIYASKLTLPSINKRTVLIGVLIIVFVLLQAIPVFKSGLNYDFGVGYWGPNGHDGIWHLALVNELMQNVPPKNPIFSGVILQNYHYFYDLLIAVSAKVTAIPTADLIFRLYPLLFSLLLAVGSYFLAKNIFHSRAAGILSVYFVTLSGSFGWIVDYIQNKSLGRESAFWANQSLSFNLNPPFAVSLVVLVVILLLIQIWLENKSKRLWLIVLILVGSLVMFKAYAAILLFLGLGLIAVERVISKKDFSLLGLCLGGGIFSILLLAPSYLGNQSLLVSSGIFAFAPFWFVHSMIDAPDRVGWERLTLARMVSLEKGQWAKLIGAEFVGVLMFILGNAGMRIVGFLSLVNVKRIMSDSFLKLLLVMAVFAVVIPLLIVQIGNTWNTIQFLYYFLFIIALTSGGVSVALAKRLPLALSVIILGAALVLTPLNSLGGLRDYTSKTPATFISNSEIAALSFLKNLPNGAVLTYPFDKKNQNKFSNPKPLFAYTPTAYVSAYSAKSTFVEDEIQADILQLDYYTRIAQSKDFFINPDESSLLNTGNIKYIYLPKIYAVSLDSAKVVRKIFENEEVLIYQVK